MKSPESQRKIAWLLLSVLTLQYYEVPMQTDVSVPTLQLLRGLTAHAEHYNQYACRTKRFSQSSIIYAIDKSNYFIPL